MTYIQPRSVRFNPNSRSQDNDDGADSWQPLGAVLRREARRLDLSRERAIVEFQAAGIHLDPEASR